MHPTTPPDSTDRSRSRRSCRHGFFGTLLPCVCWGWLLVSAGCERQADATRATAGSTTTAAADTETEPVTAAANASPIRLEPPALDFGQVSNGTTVEGTVRLINTSDQPLRVLRTRTSCGCTVADFPSEPLEPGEAAEATIRFKPRGRAGATVTKIVRFVLEGDLEPVSMQVSATIGAYVTFEPPQIAGPFVDDRKVIVRSVDQTPFRITEIAPPIAMPRLDQRPRTEHELWLSADAWSEHGSPATINLHTDHPRATTLTLRIGR